MTCTTSETGTTYEEPEFTPDVLGAQSLASCVVFRPPLFVILSPFAYHDPLGDSVIHSV